MVNLCVTTKMVDTSFNERRIQRRDDSKRGRVAIMSEQAGEYITKHSNFQTFSTFFSRIKVQHQEIIIQQPCKINGTSVLADFQLLPKYHILDPSDIYRSTLIGLTVAAVSLFALTVIVFLLNTGKMFKSKSKRR